MITLAMSSSSSYGVNSKRRRVLEKARIQKLKSWHESAKKVARSEIDFIKSIFKDENDKDSEDRDWLRDDEDDIDQKGDGALVKKDS